jgi:hypothetical protein
MASGRARTPSRSASATWAAKTEPGREPRLPHVAPQPAGPSSSPSRTRGERCSARAAGAVRPASTRPCCLQPRVRGGSAAGRISLQAPLACHPASRAVSSRPAGRRPRAPASPASNCCSPTSRGLSYRGPDRARLRSPNSESVRGRRCRQPWYRRPLSECGRKPPAAAVASLPAPLVATGAAGIGAECRLGVEDVLVEPG